MGVHTGDVVIARVRWRATVNCVVMNQELIAKTPETWESSELSVTVQSFKNEKRTAVYWFPTGEKKKN